MKGNKIMLVLLILLLFSKLVFGVSDPDTSNNFMSVNVDVLETDSFTIVYRPVDTTDDSNFKNSVTDMTDYLKEIYPIADNGVLPITSTSYETGFSEKIINSLILKNIIQEELLSKDLDRVVGILPPDWFKENSPLGLLGTLGLADIGGRSAIVEESDFFRQLVAHELGHTYGLCDEKTSLQWTLQDLFNTCPNGDRNNNGFLDNECKPQGCPTSTLGVVIPWISSREKINLYNFMGSSIHTNSWISNESYNHLLNVFKDKKYAPKASSTIIVAGFINKSSNTIELLNSYEVGERTLSIQNNTIFGNYSIELKDSSDNLLSYLNFSPSFLEIGFNGSTIETNESYFLFALNNSNVSKIIVKHNGVTKDEQSRTNNTPKVNISSVGEKFSTPFNITWNATDADNDNLSYAVLISLDNGSNYTTLVADYNDASLEVDPSDLDYSEEAVVKILATDGINTGSDITSTFTMGSPLSIDSLQAVYISESEVNFRFVVSNNANKNISNINWSIDYSDGNSNSSQITILENSSSKTININHSYLNSGIYNVTVDVINGNYSDSEQIEIPIDLTLELYINIQTLKESYGSNELVNITDPPETKIKRGFTWQDIDLGDGKHNLILYSGTRFVYEDNEWKKIEEARSLKGVWTVVKEEDPDFPVDVIDFNYTSIILDLSVSNKKLNKDINLEVYDKFNHSKKPRDNDGKEKDKDKKIRIINSDEKRREIIDLSDTAESMLGQEIKWGDNSTTIQLQDPNSENLDDTYVVEGSPNYADGTKYDMIIDTNGSGTYLSGYDSENTKINITKLVLNRGYDILNHTQVKVTIEDCLGATTITAKGWTGDSPTTLVAVGESKSCTAGSEMSLELGYGVNTSSKIWVGIEADSNITMSVDTTGENRDWYYNYDDSWILYQDVALKLDVPFFIGDQYSLITFNIAAISGKVVEEAVLALYCPYTFYTVNGSIYKINEAWVEETVTYNTKPGDTGVIISSSIISSSTYNYFNLTGAINTSENNVSFYIKRSSAGSISGSYAYFRTKEYYNSPYRPYLNITYKTEDNESKIRNDGTRNISVYLLMKVQYWNGGSWVDEATIQNDTSPRTIQPGSENQLKLDTIWNPNAWDTDTNQHGSGTYRAYVAATDENNTVLQNYDGTDVVASYNFSLNVSLKPDGESCSSDSQCQSNYCDDDGVGDPDDNWCFTPYNTYFDGQETDYCEYSASSQSPYTDEKTVGTLLNRCDGTSYYEEKVANDCTTEDNTNVFECDDTGCSCSESLCDGLTTGSNITTCSSGGTYFADKCNSTAGGEDRGDNICRSSAFAAGCIADSECDGVTAGTGYCNSSCNYIPDTTPPELTIINPVNDTTYYTTTIDLDWTANETLNWCAYSLDGGANNTDICPSGAPTNITITAVEGLNNITIYGNDTAGNMGQSDTIYFNVNLTSLVSCKKLDSENTIYFLNNNVSADSTCFNITANNITLNGQGHTIGYAQAANGDGIYSSGYNYSTIKNLNIVLNNSGRSGSQGIYLAYGSYHNITNVTIKTAGQTSGTGHCEGIYFWSVEESYISNVIINTTTSYQGHGIFISSDGSKNMHNNKITDCNVYTYGTASIGIYLWGVNGGVSDTIIEDCTVYSKLHDGINVDGGTWGNGVVEINRVTVTTDSSNDGIDLQDSDSSSITDSSFSSSTGDDIEVNGGTHVLLNVTYANEEVSAGSLTRKWYYKAYVNNTHGNNVPNANVTAYNVSDDLQFNLITDNDGYTNIEEIIDYVNNAGTKTYYSNYTIYANHLDYITLSHSYNVTMNQNNLKDVFTLVPLSDQSNTYFKNSSNDIVAWFGDAGNVVLKGTLEQNSSYTAKDNDEFRFQNSNGNDVIIIDMTNGNMYLDGFLYENQDNLNPTENSDDFIVLNETNEVVIYVNESGYMFLKGILTENGNP